MATQSQNQDKSVYQVNRQYSLKVGQGKGSGIEINELHITFKVSKGSDNKRKTNKATVRIYNLSPEHQKYVEAPFVECVLSVGYLGTGMYRLFSGQVTVAGTEKQGTDTITELQIDTFYTELNHKIVSKTAPTGVTVKGVIENLVKEMDGISRVVFSGINISKAFVDGYPMTGTPRQILNDLGEAFQLEWQIDDGIMYIQDAGMSYMQDKNKAFKISETSGLIDRPYFDQIEKQRGKKDKLRAARNGVKLKILLNPALVAGSIIYIEYGDKTGYYKIERLTHNGEYFGNDWCTELVCGTMLKL
jgi:hypothetical protein